MKKQDGLQAIQEPLSALPAFLSERILTMITALAGYEPVIGIMGKTGAGKSSLCNALFQGQVSAVHAVRACTREALRFRLRTGRHSLLLIDLPGVGESQARDEEYTALYEHWLPRLDLVLWVLKADDRALSVDEQIYCRYLGTRYRHKVLFVINQVDKLPGGNALATAGWQPSARQRQHLRQKTQDVRTLLAPVNPLCAVAAPTGWGLTSLAETLVRHLPPRASSPLAAQLQTPWCSEPVKKQARDDFGQCVGDALDTVAALPFVPGAIKAAICTVRDTVVSVARAVWGWFFG